MATIPDVPVVPLPDPDLIRDVPGGQIVEEDARREARRCATEKVDAELAREGARLRAALYDAAVIADLAVGAVGLMLADILNGVIKPKDAKQAIEIARISLAISDRVMEIDRPASSNDRTDSASSRVEKVDRAQDTIKQIRARVDERFDADRASAGIPDVDLEEFDLDDAGEGVVPARLHAVPSTQPA